jgi:hypothetical protein
MLALLLFGFFQTGRELLEVGERFLSRHDGFGALIAAGFIERYEALLLQPRQLSMHRGGRAGHRQCHGFGDGECSAGVPGSRERFEQPFLGGIELGHGGQRLNGLREVQKAEVGVNELFFRHDRGLAGVP